ncbi:hypothetical protein CEXT_225111 [Caerostris extrusa]|uniref:LAGLIDADG homing endonuclease n=1 Tax=Caerostris extrusa TaxID=172846 RepID=A0AAV4MZ28_CAEEX|nr:hypothetical protein CEXT_225111 [Caerostris extrusa]
MGLPDWRTRFTRLEQKKYINKAFSSRYIADVSGNPTQKKVHLSAGGNESTQILSLNCLHHAKWRKAIFYAIDTLDENVFHCFYWVQQTDKNKLR